MANLDGGHFYWLLVMLFSVECVFNSLKVFRFLNSLTQPSEINDFVSTLKENMRRLISVSFFLVFIIQQRKKEEGEQCLAMGNAF